VSELDDAQDWPLRDFSARLRPPNPPDGQVDEEREPEPPALTQEFAFEQPDEPEAESEPDPEPEPEKEPELPRTDASELEVLYDEDEPPAAASEEHEPLRVPAAEEREPEEASAPVEEHELAVAPAPAVEEQPSAPEPETEPEPEPEPEPQHVAGDLLIPGGYSVLEGSPNGQRRTVAIVVSRFNGEITNGLLESALGALEEAGVTREAVLVMPVPGAFELPIAAMALAKTRRYSCVVALGCVIRGETPHFDFVAAEAASGLQLAGIETGVPVSLGVLTCDTAEQAEARVERGAWAARTALEMADAFAQLRTAVARS
jgi:6,7-dimethyl-8-ribityllumazine synthase